MTEVVAELKPKTYRTLEQITQETGEFVDNNSLGVYISQAIRYPVLDPKLQQVIAKKASNGDERARERLICHNLRLVATIAIEDFSNGGYPLLDDIQRGNLGLIEAVDKFDPSRGVPFSSFASIKIRGAIVRGIDNEGTLIRVPVHAKETYRKAVRKRRLLSEKNGEDPSLEELAEEVEVKASDLRYIFRAIENAYSIDLPVPRKVDSSPADDYRRLTIAETLIDETIDPCDLTMSKLAFESFLDAIDRIEDRQSAALFSRYWGLNSDPPASTEDLAGFTGLTIHQVRDKIRSAKDKLYRDSELQESIRS